MNYHHKFNVNDEMDNINASHCPDSQYQLKMKTIWGKFDSDIYSIVIVDEFTLNLISNYSYDKEKLLLSDKNRSRCLIKSASALGLSLIANSGMFDSDEMIIIFLSSFTLTITPSICLNFRIFTFSDTSTNADAESDEARSLGCCDVQSETKSISLVNTGSTGGGSSTASSRDTSPCRELSPLVTNLKPPIIIRRGPHGLGFTVHTIRVYFGDTDFYTMHHLVMAVDEKSSAFAAGLRPADLITHINGEAVQGLYHTQVLQLLLNNSNSDHISLRATPLEHTSIQSGGRKRNALQSKLARKSVSRHKKQRKDAEKKRKSSLFRRISTKRASAEIQQLAVVISSPVGSITSPMSRLNINVGDSPLSSPSSSAPNTPTGHPNSASPFANHNKGINHHHFHHHQRPSTLHGLKHKLHAVSNNKSLHHGPVQVTGGSSTSRRKSVGHIPLYPISHPISPLARTPSPSPLSSSPTRSPSPLAFPIPGHQPGASNTTQSYSPGSALPTSNSGSNFNASASSSGAGASNSPNSAVIKKNSFSRPKSAEPGSPLLRRALSPDRLHPRAAENKCVISPLCCKQLSTVSTIPNALSIGLKKLRHNTGNTSLSTNIRRSHGHEGADPTNIDAVNTTSKDNTEQKVATNQPNAAAAMLSLALQPSTELLPIAEEKDSPTNSSSGASAMMTNNKKK